MKTKHGFTLAEVLITLAIIGVVAAITIPTLVRNYQEKVTVTKVKRMYSILSQAYKFYLAENGKAEYIYAGDEGSAEKVFKIFEPYLKIAEDCTKNGTKNCFSPDKYHLKNGNDWIQDAYDPEKERYNIRLNDGSALLIKASDTLPESKTKSYYFQALYDVNGVQPPNTSGIDVFTFLFNENGVIAFGKGNNDEKGACILSIGNGQTCAAWIIEKGNMDYLKCPDKLSWDDMKCPE